MSVEMLTEVLGWCTVINFVLLGLVGVWLMLFPNWSARIHARLFNLQEDAVHVVYFQYLANYKIAIFMLNVIPYVALKIVV